MSEVHIGGLLAIIAPVVTRDIAEESSYMDRRLIYVTTYQWYGNVRRYGANIGESGRQGRLTSGRYMCNNATRWNHAYTSHTENSITRW